MTSELNARLEELETAANGILRIINNESSVFHNDDFLKQNLVKVLKEQQAIRRKLEELKNGR